MSRIVTVGGKVGTVGGRWITDADGAPCCCGGTDPGCCFCRITGAGVLGFYDKCIAPGTQCCLGRSFRVTLEGSGSYSRLETPRFSAQIKDDGTFSARAVYQIDLGDFPECPVTVQIIESAAVMDGVYQGGPYHYTNPNFAADTLAGMGFVIHAGPEGFIAAPPLLCAFVDWNAAASRVPGIASSSPYMPADSFLYLWDLDQRCSGNFTKVWTDAEDGYTGSSAWLWAAAQGCSASSASLAYDVDATGSGSGTVYQGSYRMDGAVTTQVFIACDEEQQRASVPTGNCDGCGGHDEGWATLPTGEKVRLA